MLRWLHFSTGDSRTQHKKRSTYMWRSTKWKGN